MLIGNFFKNIDLKYKDHFFSGLSFNSHSCKRNNIFFAIQGNRFDGNKFINNSIKNGARTIVSNNKFVGVKNNVLFIKSNNVRKLLAEISYKIYKKRPKNLIAVTGTNGKSSIANFYLQILKINQRRVASIGTLGINEGSKITKVSNTTLDSLKLSILLEKFKKKKN